MKKFKIKADVTVVTIVVFLVCIVLVSVMLMQFRTVEQTDITAIENMRESELRTALAEWKNRYEDMNKQLEDVNARITEYRKNIEDNEVAADLIEEELQESNLLVGKTDVYGEGVTVTLNNGDMGVQAYDLIDLVNELRYAGAEAISINGIRVLPMTYIVDMGEYTYIMVDLQRLEAPYVVKAIGDKEELTRVLNLDGSGFVDRAVGIKVSVTAENRVEIPKYNGELDVQYMQEAVQE